MNYKIALLADVDNFKLTANELNSILSRISVKGEVVYGKLYNYSERRNSDLAMLIEENGFDAVSLTSANKKSRKSVLDIRIVIDAIKVSSKNSNIDAFCLVVGDGDVVPLISALKAEGKFVIGCFNSPNEANEKLCNEVLRLKRAESPTVVQKKITIVKAPSFKQQAVKPVAAKAEYAAVSKPAPATQPAPVYQAAQPATAPQPQPAPAYKTETTAARTYEQMRNHEEKVVAQFERDASKLIDIKKKKRELAETLESFAKRTSTLNFDSGEDVEAKRKLLNDINNCLDENDFSPSDISEEDQNTLNEIKELVTSLKETVLMSLAE